MNISYPVLGIFVALGFLVLITILLLAMIWQSFAIRRARMSVEREEAYRKLAERISDAQQLTALEQRMIFTAVDELNTRIASIEKLLHEVE